MKTTLDAAHRRRGRSSVPGPPGSGDIQPFVGVFKARYRSQGRCSCGWIGKSRLLRSSAKVDALIHAAQNDCRPTIPLIHAPGAVPVNLPYPAVQG
jgi:hypothetical protein